MKNIHSHLQNLNIFNQLKPEDLVKIESDGLAHDHIKLGNTGWIMRIPRGNQLEMEDLEYLRLQQAIYERMSPSGSTPDIFGIIKPNADLPHGALIIEYIEGRRVKSEKDLPAMAKCLAELHKMSVPSDTAPLEKAAGPLAGQDFLLSVVFNAAFENKKLPKDIKRLLQQERSDIRSQIDDLKQRKDIPLSLIGGDCHPGNYLIDKQGKAWMVDVEFGAYDIALVDLADASLEITSQQGYTTSSKAVKEFYETWSKAVGQDMTKKLTDLIPLTERAVQLRTLAWLSHWVAEGRENATLVPEKSIKNWDNMARHYFDPDNLEAMLSAKNPDAKTARRPIKNQPPKPR